MHRRHMMMATAAAVTLGACSANSKFKKYDGPEVTFVVVNKGPRKMKATDGHRKGCT